MAAFSETALPSVSTTWGRSSQGGSYCRRPGAPWDPSERPGAQAPRKAHTSISVFLGFMGDLVIRQCGLCQSWVSPVREREKRKGGGQKTSFLLFFPPNVYFSDNPLSHS